MKGFSGFSKSELRTLSVLSSPLKVQKFVEALDYNHQDTAYSPKLVLKHRKAHCLEGALLAACVFRLHGRESLLVDLRGVRDEDHVLCVFREKGLWGSVAKSKFNGLRSREPVYRTIRELVMSYFQDFFNFAGEKTLREYSLPLDLRKLDSLHWMDSLEDEWFMTDELNKVKHYRVLPAGFNYRFARVRGVVLQDALATRDKGR